MDFLTLAKERYSVRSFDERNVPAEIIDKIIEAGMVAPTACNNQPQRIIVVKGEEPLSRLRKCTKCHFDAPLAFIIAYNKNESWKRPFDGTDSGFVDASIVTTHMMLEGWELGIGSTWVMFFEPDAVCREFALPDELVPVAILPMGYASAEAAPAPLHSKSKEISELVSYGKA